jgi:hypothetical protein
MAAPVYEDVLEEVKQLAPEEQQKLAKEVLGQFKTKKTKKPAEEGADAEAAERPKRVISEEQKAKMKAGREAYLARKRAETSDSDAPAAAKKPRAKKAAAGGDDAAGEKKPSNRKPMTEEHKAAMKAGRERKKAEKAAAGGGGAAAPPAPPAPAPAAAAPEEDEEDEEEVPVHLVDWENDFGEGVKAYKRLDYEGRTYVYELETKKYLGAYVKKSNTLKPSIPDPLVPEDD